MAIHTMHVHVAAYIYTRHMTNSSNMMCASMCGGVHACLTASPGWECHVCMRSRYYMRRLHIYLMHL
jgi:hypothetical protein